MNCSWSGQLVLASVLLLSLTGCQDERLDYLEVKRIHERLTDHEINTYLRIVESLPEENVPKFPPAYPRPVQWDEKRSLTVLDLVEGEERDIQNHWKEETLVRQLEKNRKLKSQLRRAKMTIRQFIGFTKAIGSATGRMAVADERNMSQLLGQGNTVIQQLKTQSEVPFSKLEEEERHSVLQDAMWLTRVHRIQVMQQVPPENVTLVKKYKERLHKSLPQDFIENPIDAVRDLLVDYGLPFEETKLYGSDVDLTWEPAEAKRGRDKKIEDRNGSDRIEKKRFSTIRN